MSRHFVWLAPLSNLLLCSPDWDCSWRWRRGSGPAFGGWLGPRLIGLLAILPVLIVISTRIYPMAWVILAAGIASCARPDSSSGMRPGCAGGCS